MTVATAAPSDAGAPQGAKWTVVLAVVLTAVLEVLDSTIVNVALPHMKAAFGITNDQTIWILTSYIVASVAVMPLTGFFSRRFGRRRLILTAIIGFMFFSALCGLSWSVGMIVFCRLGQGIFGAFLIPLSQSILFDSFPREKRGQAMALFGLGVIVAPILGPTIGAILTEAFSWRAVFYVNLPVAAFALFMMAGELKADETRSVQIDWTGLILMIAAVAGLQLFLDLGETRDWFASHFIQVCFVIFAFAFATFIWRGIGRADNIVSFALFRDRSFAAANVAMLGFGLAMFGTISILPLFTQGLLGYGVLDAGYLFVPRGLASGATMVITGAVLMNRVDARKLVFVGLLLTGLGNLLLARLNLDAGFWDIAWPGVVAGVGMGLFFVPMSTVAFQNLPAGTQDEASGIYGVFRSLGSSIGISLVGWQLAVRTQFHWATLTGHMSATNPAVLDYLAPYGLAPDTPQAAQILLGQVAGQAQMLAYQDMFRLTGWAAFAMIPLILLMQRPDMKAGKAPPPH